MSSSSRSPIRRASLLVVLLAAFHWLPLLHSLEASHTLRPDSGELVHACDCPGARSLPPRPGHGDEGPSAREAVHHGDHACPIPSPFDVRSRDDGRFDVTATVPRPLAVRAPSTPRAHVPADTRHELSPSNSPPKG